MITRVAGLALMVMGLIFTFNIIPLSVLDTVKITTPTVSCGASGYCSVTLTVTNNNATSNFAVYMKVQNSQYETIWKNTIQAQSSASTFTTPPLSLGTLPPGAYIFSAFAVSNYGVVISQTASTAFNVGGNYVLTIDPYNPTTGRVSVSPSCNINPSTQSSCPYPVGTSVTVTYAPAEGYIFGQWCYWASGSTLTSFDGCTSSGTFGSNVLTSKSNPLTFTLNSNYELVLSISQDSPALNRLYFTVIPTVSITGCSGTQSCTTLGTVSPTGTTTIHENSANGPTSATFTATPKDANFTFSNWQVNGKNLTENPLSLSYTYLKSIQSPSAQQDFQLWAYFKQKVFYQLGVGAYAGITTTPAAKNSGTYTYPAGTQVTASIANVADNVCFTGWLVDGNDVGKQDSVTMTMDGYHSVFAQGVGKPATGCDGGGGGDGGGSVLGLALGIPMMIGGAFLTFFGKKRR